MNKYILASIILLVLDFLWLGVYMGGQYKTQIRGIQGSEMTVRPVLVLLAYTLMVVGLTRFVLPNVDKNDDLLKNSIKYGAIFGLVLYGVYDFTAGAVLKDWNINLAFIDILWGAFVYFIATYFGTKYST